VQPAAGDRVLMMTIRRKGEKPLPKSPKGIVSATGLTVPKGAQKELDKGNKALVENQIEQAKLHFTKAIELYPQFDQAYNNLGVVLIKTGDTAGGRKAFEKALELNDKFARAYVNLAKIELKDNQYEPAILLIDKSLSVEPLNSEAISVGCQGYLLTSRYEEVVAAARKLHSLPHDGMALCHFAAGVALANLKRPTDAITEYNLYLNEAKPSDALVSKARDAIEELNKQAAAGATR
jgi:tetratricopeptide (TPR) repeat protein